MDARTVVHGGMIKFWREYNPDRFNFERVNVALPKDTTILIVDTFRGRRCNTGDQVLLFAKRHGIDKKPGELTQEQRDAVNKPYMRLYEQALGELNENGNPEKLGRLMNENHALLKDAGVSTDLIDEAVSIILDNGGLGAKLTGAGGEGGALIGYVYKKDVSAIVDKLKGSGFDSLELVPTNVGIS